MADGVGVVVAVGVAVRGGSGRGSHRRIPGRIESTLGRQLACNNAARVVPASRARAMGLSPSWTMYATQVLRSPHPAGTTPHGAAVGDKVATGVAVAVGVGVTVAVGVRVAVDVRVGVAVHGRVAVGVAVVVGVGVDVGVAVAVRVGIGV